MAKTLIMMLNLTLILGLSCSSKERDKRTNNLLNYSIEISVPKSDEFKVIVEVNGLMKENNVYNFVSTLPGINVEKYDFGRLVSRLNAYDSFGQELEVKQISTNSWKILEVSKLKKLIYYIKDSFEDIDVSLMTGTSIDIDHAIINPYGVLGYFKSMKNNPATLSLQLPATWEIGSSVERNSENKYVFNNFDQIVESQFLAGKLTTASTIIEGINVDVFSYSSNNLINADQLLDYSKDVLESAGKFLNFQVAKKYTFLYVFRDKNTLSKAKSNIEGANAASRSSLYALKEERISKQGITGIMAHEFLHIISIKKEPFYESNDQAPIKHLWLQEGATEWASNIMFLRNERMSIDDYLKILSNSLEINDHFNPNISLSDIGLKSLTDKGKKHYPNIYYKGNVVCALLDIRLLELSQNRSGLRELLIQLYEKFGSDKFYSEDTLFKQIIEMTSLEIEDFINNYIKGSKPLPIEEYFSKLGIEYIESRISKTRPSLGMLVGDEFAIKKLNESIKNLKLGDKLIAIKETRITLDNMRIILDDIHLNNKAGEIIKLEIERNGQKMIIDLKLPHGTDSHVFVVKDNPNEDETKLRNRWIQN